ncbi:ribonuclease P protein subunit p25-like protein [Wyeomyia smithii]|uniref:ribonuclease P protein subunit p25-like protein n=1 Tax=Wyeomyia smithii TaxID=174621 RepID=UPI002468213A|nr:ribonuclease P protein subunit p25-like protein [Wyeomyia smithii]XP_055533934.1 ribonuclease P protein subunit p25-like protein [Wyeomyia smithii]
MMHYKKGKNVEEELSKEQIPIEVLPEQFLWMHVKGGSRIFNLVDYAKKALEAGEYRSIVWSGSGGGTGKTISCAEIMKKDFELHQVTRVCYSKVEEYWDPQQEGLEQIVATRKIPSIHILLSLDAIDPKTAGYQHSKTRTTFWMEGNSEFRNGENRKSSNYFSGPQLKKRPNKHYSDSKSAGENSNGNINNRNKNKNKDKFSKPGNDEARTKQNNHPSGSGLRNSKKANNDKHSSKVNVPESDASAKSTSSGQSEMA